MFVNYVDPSVWPGVCLRARLRLARCLTEDGCATPMKRTRKEEGGRFIVTIDVLLPPMLPPPTRRCCRRLVLRTVAGGATLSMSAFPRSSVRPPVRLSAVAFAVICHNKRLDGNPETWKIFGKFRGPALFGKAVRERVSEGDLPEAAAACLGTSSSSSLRL